MQPPENEQHGTDKGPRLVAWEVTRRCNLNCVHCRAGSENGPYEGELSTEKCLEVLGQISRVGKPIVILTGGEPLLREDIFELAQAGTELGLRMVMATNGTLLTPHILDAFKSSGIKRVSISLDGADAHQHDQFRNVPGAFERAMEGIRLLRSVAIEFQVNTTITRHNVQHVKAIMDMAVKIGAAAHHVFLLVPTGRARGMVNQEIDAQEYEALLQWFVKMKDQFPIHLKATCAPHYYRILRQEAHVKGEVVNYHTHGLDAVTRGCLGGTAFCFISNQGIIQPCGYLEVACGDLMTSTFESIWRDSNVFNQLRDFSSYKGKCGKCEYIRFCGGCRARAFEATGDFLAQEPLCAYEPARSKGGATPE